MAEGYKRDCQNQRKTEEVKVRKKIATMAQTMKGEKKTE